MEPKTYSERHTVTLTKPAQRQLQVKVIENNIRGMLESVNTRTLNVRGWKLDTTTADPSGRAWRQRFIATFDATYLYELRFVVTYESAQREPERHELESLLRTLSTRCEQAQFGRWKLSELDGDEYAKSETSVASGDTIGYAPVQVPEDWDHYFSHLFGLDDHIARVRRALEAGVISNWNNRYHCALVGPPGCGKSDICQSIKTALGEDAVLEFDATATTAAGAIKELAEREILPRILLVEEIEKADEKAMSFLLSVLDLRSQIRKTTARNTIVRDTKLFAIATVNDVPLFEKLQAGALASRFANMVSFNRPDRDQLERILLREVGRINGTVAWVKPTLDFAAQEEITDPRRVTAICLCGREMLLDGSYQRMLRKTTRTAVA